LEEGGYSKMMKSMDKVKKLTFKTLYDHYCPKYSMTKHQVNELMVERGIDDYNKQIGTNCETAKEVHLDLQQNGGLNSMTFEDTVNAMQDRGIMILITDEFGSHTAHEFLSKMGLEYPD
jgi:hypothetical protein